MNYTTLTTQVDNAVMTVTLNNGDVNLMSGVMAGELFSVVGTLAVSPEIKVVVFESANVDFFIAHFDLNDVLKSINGESTAPVSQFADINILQSLSLSIQALPQVTIAKVDGACRGGGFEFILAMDMVFASDKSRFCFPEASIGFLPAGGGATFLPIKAGKGKALEVMLTGRDFGGQEAAGYNIINQSFSDGSVLTAYINDATTRIAANNIAAIAAVKATLKKTFAGFTDGVMAGLAQENESMVSCISDPAVFESLQVLAKISGAYVTEIDLPATIRELK